MTHTTITNAHLSATIAHHGAELVSLRDPNGAELMTDADPAFWPKHAPILFPVVGVTNGGVIRVDACEYPMPKHGFARDHAFEVVEAGPSHVTFALIDSAETRIHYPFAFRLELAFRLTDATLDIEARIINPAAAELPASFGFHPAFAWPLPYGAPRADHGIVFSADEPDALRTIAPDGTIAPETARSPLTGRTLALADDLFVPDALVWDHIRSDSVTYGAGEGPSLRIDFPETPMLGIWTKVFPSDATGGVEGPGARFVCVEPWHGIADPSGYTGEYRDKPGVFTVAPGEAKHIAMRVTLVP